MNCVHWGKSGPPLFPSLIIFVCREEQVTACCVAVSVKGAYRCDFTAHCPSRSWCRVHVVVSPRPCPAQTAGHAGLRARASNVERSTGDPVPPAPSPRGGPSHIRPLLLPVLTAACRPLGLGMKYHPWFVSNTEQRPRGWDRSRRGRD